MGVKWESSVGSTMEAEVRHCALISWTATYWDRQSRIAGHHNHLAAGPAPTGHPLELTRRLAMTLWGKAERLTGREVGTGVQIESTADGLLARIQTPSSQRGVIKADGSR